MINIASDVLNLQVMWKVHRHCPSWVTCVISIVINAYHILRIRERRFVLIYHNFLARKQIILYLFSSIKL